MNKNQELDPNYFAVVALPVRAGALRCALVAAGGDAAYAFLDQGQFRLVLECSILVFPSYFFVQIFSEDAYCNNKVAMSIVVVIMIVIHNCYDCSSMQDEEGNQFIAYFTPTKEYMEKRRTVRARPGLRVSHLLFE